MQRLFFPFPQYGRTARLTQPLFRLKLVFGENHLDCGSAVLANYGPLFTCEIPCRPVFLKPVNELEILECSG